MSQPSPRQIASDGTTKPVPPTLPILASVLLHGVIIVAVAAPLIAPQNKDTGMSASLISQADFADASAALKAHHAKNSQNQASSAARPSQQPSSSHRSQPSQPSQPSRSTSSQFNTPVYTPIPDTPNYASSFSDNANDTMRNQALADANNALNRGFSGGMSDGEKDNGTHATSLTSPQGNHQNGSAGGGLTGTQGTATVNVEAARAAITHRIEANWKRYPNAANQAISFTVNLDDAGNLKSISFGAGHQELRESAEASVRAAAPFSELAGVRKSFNMRLVTEQAAHP